MPRKDPFQTLDDPEPTPAITAERIASGHIRADQITTVPAGVAGIYAAGAGYWDKPNGRPAWWRRLLVRLVLGWKWRDYDAV